VHLRFTRPYLDADAWIHALQGTEDGIQILRPLLAAVDVGRLRLAVSALMPVELLGGGSDSRTNEQEERALAALRRPNVIEIPVNRSLVLHARRLRIEHGLKSMDALHLASAMRGGADAYLTYDQAALRIGDLVGIRISRPYWYGDVPLPDAEE
jgi:predicted nucleic acid-binding protein